MAKRSLINSQREWLLGELVVWRERGLISAQQEAGILDQYESPGEVAGRRRSYAVFALMSCAALLCGLAVLLLVGYNWDEMSRTAKLVTVLGTILATHAAAFHLRFRRESPMLSESVFFLGCLLYGVGIWLIAQVFHLDSHYPDGVWMWAIGVLPFALLLDTLLLHGLLVALLALWAGLEVLGFSHLGGWLFGRWAALPNGAYTLPLLALPGLVWAYRKNSPLTVGLYAGLLAWWAALQPFAFRWDVDPLYVFGFIGCVAVLLLIAAESHRGGSRFAMPYRVFGGLLGGGLLIPLSFFELYDEFDGPVRESFGPGRMLAVLALPVVAIGFAAVLHEFRRRRSHDERPLSAAWLDHLRRLWFPALLLTIMTYVSLSGGLMRSATDPIYDLTPIGHAALVGTILANIGMIACAYWLVQIGLSEDRGLFFATGVLYFLLWAVLRYVDLFGDFAGMLGASFMFFLCAGALFGVALYWQRRKEVRHA